MIFHLQAAHSSPTRTEHVPGVLGGEKKWPPALEGESGSLALDDREIWLLFWFCYLSTFLREQRCSSPCSQHNHTAELCGTLLVGLLCVFSLFSPSPLIPTTVPFPPQTSSLR